MSKFSINRLLFKDFFQFKPAMVSGLTKSTTQPGISTISSTLLINKFSYPFEHAFLSTLTKSDCSYLPFRVQCIEFHNHSDTNDFIRFAKPLCDNMIIYSASCAINNCMIFNQNYDLNNESIHFQHKHSYAVSSAIFQTCIEKNQHVYIFFVFPCLLE